MGLFGQRFGGDHSFCLGTGNWQLVTGNFGLSDGSVLDDFFRFLPGGCELGGCVGSRRLPLASAGLDETLATRLDGSLAAARLDEALAAYLVARCRFCAGTSRSTTWRGTAGGEASLGGDLVAAEGAADEYVALVHPALDADGADGGARHRGAVVDVGSQGVQRDPAFEVPLASTHVGSAEPATCLNSNTLGSGLERSGYRTLHGPPEGNTTLELVGDAASQQGGVKLRVGDFDDVEFDLTPAELLEPGAQPVRFGSAAPDHHTGSPGVDIDLHLLVTESLDVDPGNGAALELVE